MTSLQTSLQHTAIIGANVYSLTNVRFVRPIIILILCDLKMVYSDISCHVFWSFFKKKNVIQNTNRCPNICCHFFTFYQSLFICGPSKLFIFLHRPTAIPNNKMHSCSLFIPKGRYEIPTEIQQQLNTVINSQKTK